jgi:hypothetical protein
VPESSASPDAGVAAIAQALGLAVPPDGLTSIAAGVRKMYADLERLRDLPIDGRRPALPPLVPLQPAARAGTNR